MLHFIRKNKKSFLGVFVVAIAVFLMLGFGLGSYFGRPQRGPVAKVNDIEISYQDVLRRYQQLVARYRQQFGANFSAVADQLNLKQQALDMLINEILLDQFTAELGLSAGKEQVKERIFSSPFFGGAVTKRNFRSYLAAVGMTEAQLQRATQKELVREQLTALFSHLNVTTDTEFESLYKEQNTKVKLRYATIESKNFESKVDTSDEEKIKSFYEEHREDYRQPKHVRFSFATFAPQDFLDAVEVTDEDLKDLYEEEQQDPKSMLYEPKKVHLRQIFFKAPEEDEPDSAPIPGLENTNKEDKPLESAFSPKDFVRQNAKDAFRRLGEGENFEKLAKEISEDHTTQEKGGDMGWLPFSSLFPELRDAATELEIGEFSDVVETKTEFHIVYVEDIKEPRLKDFEEVRDSLEKQLRKTLAPLYARAHADNFLHKWTSQNAEEEPSLAEFANTENLKVTSTAKLLGPNSKDPAVDAALLKEALRLNSGERETYSVGDIHYLMEIDEVQETSIPPLEETRDAVIKDYTKEQSKVLAKEFAETLLSEAVAAEGEETDVSTEAGPARAVKSLSDLKDSHQITVKSSNDVTRTTAFGDVFSVPQVKDIAFLLTEDRPLANTVFEQGDTLYLLELEGITLPDDKELESKIKQLKNSESMVAGNRMFETLLAGLRKNANIERDTKLLESLRN